MATARWQTLQEMKVGGDLWTEENLFRCDPYLLWADAVTRPGDGTALDIAVLVELKKADDYLAFLKPMILGASNPSQPGFLPNGFEPAAGSKFVTGFVNRAGLEMLVRRVVARDIERFSIQNSRRDIAAGTLERWTRAKVSLEPRDMCEVLCTPVEGSATPDATPKTGTYLGIIDDGLPFLRVREVASAARPKVHLWDQGWRNASLPEAIGPSPGSNAYWEAAWELPPAGGADAPRPRGFLYGRRLKLPPTAAQARRTNDRDEYLLSGYNTPSPRKTHGASVLGLMAPWVVDARAPVSWPKHTSGLAMVQLPTATVLDTSGGSLAMRVLDGLRYVLWQEERDRGGHSQRRPIVVNISYGVHAGPHDGSSMFERAIEEMLEEHLELEVVLPVGNAAQAECHARRVLQAPGDAASMDLEVLPDNGRDTFVEVWMPKGAKVKLSIRPPGSADAFDVEQGHARVHFDPDPADAGIGTVHFAAVYAEEVAQGIHGSMALLAIGPTRRAHRASGSRALNQQARRPCLAPAGIWQLTVTNVDDKAITVDAWIERDDAPPDRVVGNRQARFLDATPEGTLNGIATLVHQHLHVVGAMQVDGALSGYSAAGPARLGAFEQGPKVVAPADWGNGLPGLRTTGFLRGAVTRVNGTSAACAVYTRWLAETRGTVPPGPDKTQAEKNSPPEAPRRRGRKKQAEAKQYGQEKRGRFEHKVEL